MKTLFKPSVKSKKKTPYFEGKVSAGFPSPADDFADEKIDLNELLIKHPAATFFVRVKGKSMKNAGIRDGDLLVVDRAEEPKNNSIVVALLNGEFTVKRIRIKNKQMYLVPENKHFKETEITDDLDFEIWGIVKHVIKSF